MVQKKFIIGEFIASRMACHFTRKNNPKSENLIYEHFCVYRSRTGGGSSHAIGSTEARRLGAKDFLIALKDTVGITNYLTLVDHLKSLHLRVITIPQCREVFKSHLKEHPEMLKRFEDYLPVKFR